MSFSYRETIREYSGMIVGYLDHDSNGDVTVKKYSGIIIGYYRKSSDTTTDLAGRILYRGNMAPALLVLFK